MCGFYAIWIKRFAFDAQYHEWRRLAHLARAGTMVHMLL